MYKASILCVAFIIGCVVASASAATYTGSLSYSPPAPPDAADGLWVDGVPTQWPVYNVSISWEVTDQDTTYASHPWKYTYTFGHDGSQGAISHIIIEGSEGITAGDITGLSGGSLDSAGEQRVMSGNEGMPEDLTGLRFDPLGDSQTSMTWTFYSNRMPVWGDFYARCGNKQNLGVNRAYNFNDDGAGTQLGFTVNDVDPIAPAADGSLDFHILRPDSVVPEPATVAILTAGACLGLLRKKR